MLLKALLVFALVVAAGSGHAHAQYRPPQTLVGTVSDAAGPVPAGVSVVAYIGDVICSIEDVRTFVSSGVTMYAIDVVEEAQVEGCGTAGAAVRIEVGGRFAKEAALWRAGPLFQHNLTFGDATPIPIPTFTPAPPTSAPIPATSTAMAGGPTATSPATDTVTPAADSTQAGDGTPDSGTTPGGSGTATIDEGETATDSDATSSPTLPGGVTTDSSSAAAGDGGGDGGSSIWLFIVLFAAAIAVVGGGMGYFLSRKPTEDV